MKLYSILLAVLLGGCAPRYVRCDCVYHTTAPFTKLNDGTKQCPEGYWIIAGNCTKIWDQGGQ